MGRGVTRPGAQTKPGSATLPFFGVVPVLKNAHSGATIEGNDVAVRAALVLLVLCVLQQCSAWRVPMHARTAGRVVLRATVAVHRSHDSGGPRAVFEHVRSAMRRGGRLCAGPCGGAGGCVLTVSPRGRYMRPYPHHYFTGDGAIRDKDGYYWITGRVDGASRGCGGGGGLLCGAGTLSRALVCLWVSLWFTMFACGRVRVVQQMC